MRIGGGRRRRAGWVIGLLALAAAGAGCTDRLETGYEPRRLGASPAARRGYYAPPFTTEAAAARQDQSDELRSLRRPVSPGGR